ncbi:MAG: phosphate-starvation-inducible PsiE family protein [Enterococcus sp.]
MSGRFDKFEKVVSVIVDIMVAFLVVIVLIVMGEAIYNIVTRVIPLTSMNQLSVLIEEIATLFILLEIILMLIRYVREGHHIPVRYLVLISMTAILREILLAHGQALDTILLSLAILILVGVLVILEQVKAFQRTKSKD